MLLALVALAGCGPTKPDPIAPTVVTRAETIDVPVATPRTVPAELLEPIGAVRPEWRAQGDYCLTYDAFLELLDAVGLLEDYHTTCLGFAGGEDAD